MSKRVKAHVGTLEEMGERFVSAWHRLEKGEKVRERHLTFPDLRAMLNALTPKRLELLQDVHKHPAPSVKALAERLGRDYKRVHEMLRRLQRLVFSFARTATSLPPTTQLQPRCGCSRWSALRRTAHSTFVYCFACTN